MTQGRGLFILMMLVGMPLAAQPQESVWLARLTGERSCEPSYVLPLGESVQDLERAGLYVEEAKVGRLAQRYFCSACHCPRGTFHILRVAKDPQVEILLEHGDWEEIKEEEILPTSAPRQPRDNTRTHPDFMKGVERNIQPVIPVS